MWQEEEGCLLKNKVDKQWRTSYQEDTGGDVVLVWFKFICRNQKVLYIYCRERGFELCITNGNTVLLMCIKLFSYFQKTIFTAYNTKLTWHHPSTILLKLCLIRIFLDSLFSNAGCCHTNLMCLTDRQQRQHINNWTTPVNW